MILRCILIGMSCVLVGELKAQEYQIRQYRVEHGLPSDVIKAVAQDSLGFIWIASDDGLVKYDGIQFTTYKSAQHSQYTKGLVRTKTGRFFAIGDLDLIEIINKVDTVIFRSVLQGARTPSDTTIWYPKAVYEDNQGSLWMAEPQSVVRFNGKEMKRFDFGSSNRSIVFIRSFSFIEDNEHLYAFSYGGNVFRINKSTDTIDQLPITFPDRVSHTLLVGNKVLVCTGGGIYESVLKDGLLSTPKILYPIINPSHLLFTADSTLWVGTFGDILYQIKAGSQPKAIPHDFKGINSLYQSDEGDFWVSTDKGLVLMQPNQFSIPDKNSLAHFIEGMAYDEARETFYYCTKETLNAVRWDKSKRSFQSEILYFNSQSYFQSLRIGKEGLWAGVDFRVMLFQNEKIKNTWDFSSEGNFIHDVFVDQQQNVWLSQADNSNIIVITPTMGIKRYPLKISKQSEINLAREGKRGIYVAASGTTAYLFLKPHDSSAFKNISAYVKFPLQSDLNIIDLAVGEDDVLWMASTEGLLRFKSPNIERVNLGETFTTLSVSSVEFLDSENILFSNSYGLFRYNIKTNDYWLYDEHAGLPSNTVTDQGILIDYHSRLWVGTSYGVAFAENSIITDRKTPTPFCVEARVNGVPKRYANGLTAQYGAFINLKFSSITFPENKIYMQWRLTGGDTTWRTLTNRELSLSELPSKEHIIEVRAKKNTGLDWSDPLLLSVTVEKPYWQQPNFIMLILLGILLIMWFSYLISARITKSRREILQNLVNQRTHDLQKANEELQQRNAELDRFVYSTSHDLSAPLKSLLGLISVARMDDTPEGKTQYLGMMERSVRKLEDFIQEVVSYSRNTRSPITWEPCNFVKFVENILADHQYSPDYNTIQFIIEDHLKAQMITDRTRLKIILNNLISNAIKFQYSKDQTRKPFVKISLRATSSHYILKVEDNGKGIEQQHLKHIFDMFYRANEYAQGSGLGLYILKESVLKLGGTVEATSNLGEGTTFTVMLPIPAIAN